VKKILVLRRNTGERASIFVSRQIYRQYIWPDTFEREEVTKVVDEVADLIETCGRGECGKTQRSNMHECYFEVLSYNCAWSESCRVFVFVNHED
jgi:hypothetical protein